MLRINAEHVPADVVNLKLRRYWTDARFIGEAMGIDRSARKPKLAISMLRAGYVLDDCADPAPTPIFQERYFFKEPRWK